jgi:uncharacterized protein YcbK (DUF882 family)
MASRRDFLHHGLRLTALGLVATPLIDANAAARSSGAGARPQTSQATPLEAPSVDIAPPPDLFDAQVVDLDFWVKPRTLSVVRPASGERSRVLYWKDGEMIDSAYQELCHILRDVNGKASIPIDPKLLETLWASQAFVERYGLDKPLEILSGYRTPASNQHLIEQGVPAARQSLHMSGKAADIRIAGLTEEVLGGLVRSFRQGGVGFYYRSGPKGGWIHADTGLKRTWQG